MRPWRQDRHTDGSQWDRGENLGATLTHGGWVSNKGARAMHSEGTAFSTNGAATPGRPGEGREAAHAHAAETNDRATSGLAREPTPPAPQRKAGSLFRTSPLRYIAGYGSPVAAPSTTELWLENNSSCHTELTLKNGAQKP